MVIMGYAKKMKLTKEHRQLMLDDKIQRLNREELEDLVLAGIHDLDPKLEKMQKQFDALEAWERTHWLNYFAAAETSNKLPNAIEILRTRAREDPEVLERLNTLLKELGMDTTVKL